jgi:hypothetical protein
VLLRLHKLLKSFIGPLAAFPVGPKHMLGEETLRRCPAAMRILECLLNLGDELAKIAGQHASVILGGKLPNEAYGLYFLSDNSEGSVMTPQELFVRALDGINMNGRPLGCVVEVGYGREVADKNVCDLEIEEVVGISILEFEEEVWVFVSKPFHES